METKPKCEETEKVEWEEWADNLPNEGESFLFGNVIDSDLFPRSRVVRSQFGQIYLESNFDFLSQGSGREDGLNLWDDCGRDHAAIWTNGVNFLANPRNDGEILREIRRQDTSYPVRVHVFQLSHFYSPNNSMSLIKIIPQEPLMVTNILEAWEPTQSLFVHIY